jgi:hypothetical protein
MMMFSPHSLSMEEPKAAKPERQSMINLRPQPQIDESLNKRRSLIRNGIPGQKTLASLLQLAEHQKKPSKKPKQLKLINQQSGTGLIHPHQQPNQSFTTKSKHFKNTLSIPAAAYINQPRNGSHVKNKSVAINNKENCQDINNDLHDFLKNTSVECFEAPTQ